MAGVLSVSKDQKHPPPAGGTLFTKEGKEKSGSLPSFVKRVAPQGRVFCPYGFLTTGI